MPPASPLRALVADTAASLGPDAPTLCEPWDVRLLVAHLVARESRPDALPGIGLPVPALQRHTENVQASLAEQDFDALVTQFREGPPRWWPTRIPALERAGNAAEHAIHLEDMVRARPGWEPTELPQDVQAALWATLRGAGRVLYRNASTGVVAIAEGHGRVAFRRPPGRAGTVVLRGTPLELILHAFGRERVARLSIEGADEDVAALATHRRRA